MSGVGGMFVPTGVGHGVPGGSSRAPPESEGEVRQRVNEEVLSDW